MIDKTIQDPFQKLIKHLGNDPIQKLIKQMETDPFRKAIMRMENDPIQKLFKQMESDPFRKLIKQMESDPFQKLIKQMGNSPIPKFIQHLEQTSFRSLDINSVSQLGLAFETASSLSRVNELVIQDSILENDETADEVNELFQGILDRLNDAVRTAQSAVEIRSIVSFAWKYLWLILTVLMIVRTEFLAYQSSAEHESSSEMIEAQGADTKERIDKVSRDTLDQGNQIIDKINTSSQSVHDDLEQQDHKSEERFEELGNKIGALTKSLNDRWAETIQATYYVVLRPTALTNKKEENAPVIRWLQPGEEVEVMERNKKWIKVITYDTSLNQTNVGWVLKNDLRRLD